MINRINSYSERHQHQPLERNIKKLCFYWSIMSDTADTASKNGKDKRNNRVLDSKVYNEEQKLNFLLSLLKSFIFIITLPMSFMLPWVEMAIVYTTAMCVKLYRYYFKIQGKSMTYEMWEAARDGLGYFFSAQGRFWHGYEIHGADNIPKEGPALIVFYHGAIPIDWYYFLAYMRIKRKRNVRTIGDRFLFTLPGFKDLTDCLVITIGTVDSCANILRNGNLLGIAPGGVREMLFGDENYPLIWEKRCGFAKAAIEAKVPIIPMFTKNIREAFFSLDFGRKWFRELYERTRQPVVPVFGGYPVKLTTIIGEPIPYDPNCSAEELAEKVACNMKNLIKLHQQTPGSVARAIMERFLHLVKIKVT